MRGSVRGLTAGVSHAAPPPHPSLSPTFVGARGKNGVIVSKARFDPFLPILTQHILDGTDLVHVAP